jgi:hypothetical protein
MQLKGLGGVGVILRRVNNEGDPDLDYVMTDCSCCGKMNKLVWECEDSDNRDNHGNLYCKECGDAMILLAKSGGKDEKK